MKIVLVCFMLLFVCSCHNNSDNSILGDSKETNRHEEILKIMRADSIHQIEVAEWKLYSAEQKEKLLNEARMAKENYYYVMDPNVIITLPGPGWEIEGPLPFDNVKNEKFREKCEEGDELYFYRSDRKSWAYLRGREGYVIIRNNKVAAKVVTALN